MSTPKKSQVSFALEGEMSCDGGWAGREHALPRKSHGPKRSTLARRHEPFRVGLGRERATTRRLRVGGRVGDVKRSFHEELEREGPLLSSLVNDTRSGTGATLGSGSLGHAMLLATDLEDVV